jgi:two-component system NtrC family sensor kinase
MKPDEAAASGGLLSGFLLVILLLLALAGIALAYLREMNDTITHIVDGHVERSRLATEMYIAARERALQLHAILQEPDPFARDALVPRFHELAGIFRGARRQLMDMPLSLQERDILQQQNRHTTQGSLLQDEVLDLALADHQAAAARLLLTRAIPTQNLATVQLRRLVDEQVHHGQQAAQEARGEYQVARRLLIASAMAATLLAALIAVVVIRRQSRLLGRLREREHDARVLLETIPVPVWFKDTAARIAWFNGSFEKMADRPGSAIAGQQERAIWGEEAGQQSELEDKRALESGQTTRHDRRLTPLNSERQGHYTIARTPVAENGNWKGVLCVAHDHTAMERMNDLLEQTNQELQAQKTALDEHAIVSIADIGGFITYVNDKFCAISGYSRENLIGRSHGILNSGLHPREFFESMWQTIAGGQVWHGEIRNRRRDGSYYWVDSTIVPFLDSTGRPTRYIAIRTDISVRKQMEESLQDINVELQQRVNERTEALSQAMRQLEADIAERTRSQGLLQQQYLQLESLHSRLQEAQSQLLQSEKMASIGQLAAGVAHEINNPIGYVHSNLGTLDNYIADLFKLIAGYEASMAAGIAAESDELASLKRKLDLDYLREDIPQLLSESKDGISRVRKIVQDLKDFSRLDSSPDWQYANLHQGLDSTLNIVQNEIKYRADVVKDYALLPQIECIPSQLNQVFINLLVNAAQAIEGPRGCITLRTRVAESGQEISVEVADTGRGISEEIRSRIFDPFFTTKPVGKGTGLGLSLAYGIIQKHHGRIEVTSEPGHGTTFRVTLPIHQMEAINAT